MLDLTPLKMRVLNGERISLYWGVRSLDKHIPIPPEFSQVFMHLARVVEKLHPDRLSCIIETSFDARIVLLDFCEHHNTTQHDILQVIEETIESLENVNP